MPRPSEDAWVKLCMKSEQTQNKEICLINHEGLEPNTGMVLIAAAVRKVEGEEKQQLLVRVPTAYALVMPAGVQIKIDEQQPIQLQYTICFPTSCQVQLELTKEMFDSMRKGKQMVVAAMNIQQKTMGFPVPLTGFAKAYDGAPVDSVKYEESRRQLMEMFRKRQADLAAKAAKASGRTRPAPPGRPPRQPPATPTAPQKSRCRNAVSCTRQSFQRSRKAAPVLRGGLSLADRAQRCQCSCRKRKRKMPSFRSSNSSATCGWRSGSSDASGTRFCSDT